jgi:hypothetical protein
MQRRWQISARQRPWRAVLLLLWSGCGLLSCVPWPAQPEVSQPYALLVLPGEVRVLALDTQSVDPRVQLRDLRISPGLHRLRFAYAGSSPQHTGQEGPLLCLETQAGHQYHFEAKTRGIMWRPAIETDAVIPGYCTTHTCTEAERRVSPQPPMLALCPETTKEVRPGP